MRSFAWRQGRARTLAAVTLTVAVATIAAACGSSAPSAPAAKTVKAPGLPNFYAVPVPLPPGGPGTLIKSVRVPQPGLDGTLYRVMYISETALGARTAVTGLVAVPSTPAPAGGYPVVTWGHGTNGMAPQCAPSLQPASAVPYANGLLQKGWEVVASDYQGEGTPGMLPYLVGVVAARNTIDIVRAARELPAAHASANYVVWGHSEGGQTAMFALHIGASYAPELHLDGVVAGAPPSQFSVIYDFLKTSKYRFYLFMAAAGFNAAYGNTTAPLNEVLSAQARKLLPDLTKGCFTYLENTLDHYSLTQLVEADPFSVPKWKPLLEENDPASFTSPVAAPLLIIQGGADEQIPVISTQLLASHLCSIGQDLERWIYPGQSHSGVISVSMQDMIHWMADRFAGGPNPDPYVPKGEAGIQTTSCP